MMRLILCLVGAVMVFEAYLVAVDPATRQICYHSMDESNHSNYQS